MKRGIKENKPKVEWKQANGLSEEEAKRNLDRAFGLLFSETMRTHKKT